jgi:hypothetical protein
VSLPLDDNTPAGVLDVTSAVFEFIPLEQSDRPAPDTLAPGQLEVGRDYVVVLTNTAGLLRYRLDDVVRVRGWLAHAPLVEFLHRAGRVASVAGEKLTENQAVDAVKAACRRLGIPEFDFLLVPRWADPPFYRLYRAGGPAAELPAAVDEALGEQNEEYASRRKSNRIGYLVVEALSPNALAHIDQRLMACRRATAEQYKRPCLLTTPDADDDLFGRD